MPVSKLKQCHCASPLLSQHDSLLAVAQTGGQKLQTVRDSLGRLKQNVIESLAFLRALPWQAKAAGVIAAAFLILWAAYSYQKARADRAVAEARQSRVTAEALDTVATQVPSIRSEQEEKQRAVDQIEGADQRLPDGFAADLQRLRDQRRNDPR
jgi:hypothetical protein